MDSIGEGHAAVVHPGQVAEEVGKCFFEVPDPPRFPDVENGQGSEGDKDRNHRDIVDYGGGEQDRHPVLADHRNRSDEEEDQRYRQADDQDIDGFVEQDLERMLDESPEPFAMGTVVGELVLDLLLCGVSRGILIPGIPSGVGWFDPGVRSLSKMPMLSLRCHGTDHDDEHDTAERDHHVDDHVEKDRVCVVPDDRHDGLENDQEQGTCNHRGDV